MKYGIFVKFIAVLLTAVSLVAAAGGVVGIVAMESADLYVDGFRGDENCTVATTELRNFVQIDSATAYSLTPGTKLRVGDYTLDIEQVTFSTIDGVDYLDISGWEYAMYLSELGVWRFYGVNDQALTYSGGSANLLIPTTAQVWDYLTPFAYGHNVYGVDLPASYDLESDYFRLERVDDFYYWHQNAGSVGAYVTVKDGVITRLEIPYHP